MLVSMVSIGFTAMGKVTLLLILYFIHIVFRLEQELMARIITEIYPLRDNEQPAEISHLVSEDSEDSMAEEKEQSMFGKLSLFNRTRLILVAHEYMVV